MFTLYTIRTDSSLTSIRSTSVRIRSLWVVKSLESSRSRTPAGSTPPARAPDSARYPWSSAGLLAITLVMFGVRPRVFCTSASSSAALPVAVAGSTGRNEFTASTPLF